MIYLSRLGNSSTLWLKVWDMIQWLPREKAEGKPQSWPSQTLMYNCVLAFHDSELTWKHLWPQNSHLKVAATQSKPTYHCKTFRIKNKIYNQCFSGFWNHEMLSNTNFWQASAALKRRCWTTSGSYQLYKSSLKMHPRKNSLKLQVKFYLNKLKDRQLRN